MNPTTTVVLSQDKTISTAVLRSLSDEELVVALDSSANDERASICSTLRLISEVESRRLHVDMGYRTMFDYCVLRLKFSEGAAARRIYSARAAAARPELYERIRSGDLNLTSVSRLAPHLTDENAKDLILRASGARLREVETIVAGLSYREARKVPEASETPAQGLIATTERGPERMETAEGAPVRESSAEPATFAPAVEDDSPDDKPPSASAELSRMEASRVRIPRDSITLEAPGVIRFVFRAGPEFRAKIELAARLLGRRPDGRLETLLGLLAEYFLKREDPAHRKARRTRPARRRTRRIARWIRDEVWRRDGGRCAYRGPDGTRCAATNKIEYDHVVPWAIGGASDDPANIRLLCRAHNLHLARRAFGAKVPAVRA